LDCAAADADLTLSSIFALSRSISFARSSIREDADDGDGGGGAIFADLTLSSIMRAYRADVAGVGFAVRGFTTVAFAVGEVFGLGLPAGAFVDLCLVGIGIVLLVETNSFLGRTLWFARRDSRDMACFVSGNYGIGELKHWRQVRLVILN
jgi:hypothetical protein